jgi:hypothetical protein
MVTKQNEDSRSTFSTGVGISRLRSCKRRKCWKRGSVGWPEDKKRKHASANTIAPEGSLQTHLYEGILCPKQACHCEKLMESTYKIILRLKMKMKLRFRASHEHANSEQGCTSDLKHALLTTPMMLKMRMLPVLLPVWLPGETCQLCPGGGSRHAQTACKPARGRRKGYIVNS